MDAGQFFTVGAQEVMVITSVWKNVDVERTGAATVPFEGEADGVETTPAAVPSEYAGTVALDEGVATTAAFVLIGDEDVATTPAAALVEEVLGEDRVAEPEALVKDARIAELADSASVTGQTVCRLLAMNHNPLLNDIHTVSTVIVSVTTITFVASGWPAGQFVIVAAQLVIVWVTSAKTVNVV